MPPSTKHDRLVESAAELFHKQGMLSTSLADIAKHAEIPIGNVYYYFKTKDELARAALLKQQRALEEIYEHLESNFEDPRHRLIQLVGFFEKVADEYTRFGCPIYRMIPDCGDVNNEESVAYCAATIYRDFIKWVQGQFEQLGHGDDSRTLAISLLAGIQGGAVVANAFSESDAMVYELDRLRQWLLTIPNKKIFLGKAGAKAPA